VLVLNLCRKLRPLIKCFLSFSPFCAALLSFEIEGFYSPPSFDRKPLFSSKFSSASNLFMVSVESSLLARIFRFRSGHMVSAPAFLSTEVVQCPLALVNILSIPLSSYENSGHSFKLLKQPSQGPRKAGSFVPHAWCRATITFCAPPCRSERAAFSRTL